MRLAGVWAFAVVTPMAAAAGNPVWLPYWVMTVFSWAVLILEFRDWALARWGQTSGTRVGRILNFLWPMCPSGMPHRARGGIVHNWLGKPYCWHPDCMRTNFRECEVPGYEIPNASAADAVAALQAQIEQRGAVLPESGPGAPETMLLPMEAYPADRTPVLLRFKAEIPGRPDMTELYAKHWIVGSSADDRMGWSLHGPFGTGGWPDDWFDGWLPLPEDPPEGKFNV